MWALIAPDGRVLAQYGTSEDAYEATYTGEYGDDVEVAYIN